jgi:hypothetical protein
MVRHAAPRIHRFLPAKTILEIALGFGRWTKFLIPHAQSFTGIDLSEECVDACRESFATVKKATFRLNDGRSLVDAPNHLDFVFSFDSMVHVEIDVLDGYIAQIVPKLAATGAAFIHHSNFADAPATVENIHGRATDVSARAIAASVEKHGGRVIIQELVNWGCEDHLIDCMTIFSRGVPAPYTVLHNPDFFLEAASIKKTQAVYSTVSGAGPRQQLEEHHRVVNYAVRAAGDEAKALEALTAQLRAIETSTSWRLTGPARWLISRTLRRKKLAQS